MELVVYAKENVAASTELEAAIRKAVPGQDIATYRSLEELERRLQQPRKDWKLAVLKTCSGEELKSILLMRDLLSDLHLIVILPDRDEETISLAHQLGPRFLSYADNDLNDIGSVLTNLVRRLR